MDFVDAILKLVADVLIFTAPGHGITVYTDGSGRFIGLG